MHCLDTLVPIACVQSYKSNIITQIYICTSNASGVKNDDKQCPLARATPCSLIGILMVVIGKKLLSTSSAHGLHQLLMMMLNSMLLCALAPH
mmetsp:Transcript_21557/g.45334  ORF Transcript_21557/g.45334 Transcript_21557/m.45334 type:complete len:92 (+) Transcript_21557:165-440(+)